MSKILKYKCELCDRQFTDRRNYAYHRRKFHGLDVDSPKIKKYVCPLCGNSFAKADLNSHFASDHEQNIEVERKEFGSYDAFLLWKEEFERQTFSKFTPCRTASQGKVKYYYFECHRSGHYSPKGLGLRHLKVKGSNKINGHCPAAIKVCQDSDGTCNITVTKTHIGHKNELDHLSLSSAERHWLAGKIAAKVPFENILDEVRDSVSADGIRRIHLLTRKDLHNIVESFHLRSIAVMRKDSRVSDIDVNNDGGRSVIKEEVKSPKALKLVSLDQRKKNLKKELCELIDSLTSAEEIQTVEETLHSLRPTIRSNQSCSHSNGPVVAEKVDVNENIVMRKQLIAHKRVGKSKKSTKPNVEECQNTAYSLILLSKSQ